MTQSRRTPSVGELLAALVVLPSLAYGFGFLMWAGPAKATYGYNVALILPVSALVFPGSVYLVFLGLSVLFAIMLGPERLAGWLPIRRRWLAIGIEAFLWAILATVVTLLSGEIAGGHPPTLIVGGLSELLYMAIHVSVLGFAFRRLYGLMRARCFPPTPDRRAWSPRLRVLHALAFMSLLVVQIPFALMFGVMGANPAKEKWPVIVHEGGMERRGLLISQTSNRILIFDESGRHVVSLPLTTDTIVEHVVRPR